MECEWEAVELRVGAALSTSTDVLEADTADSLEKLRLAIAAGLATRAAILPGAIETYVKALECCCSTVPCFALAATACVANAVFAATTTTNGTFVSAFARRGGTEAVLANCKSALPALAYVALIKIIHITVATTKSGTVCVDDTLATTLHWVLEMDDAKPKVDDCMNQQLACNFLGSVAGDPQKGRDKERLAKELLNACYAFVAHDASRMHKVLLSAIWRLISKDSPLSEVFGLQVAAVRLMMLAPSFASCDEPFVIKKVLFLLKVQLWRYTIEGVIDAPDRDVVPLLRVAQELNRASPTDGVMRTIFPFEAHSHWKAEVPDDPELNICAMQFDNFDKCHIHPADAPPFALRTFLFSLQTDIHSIVRRFANEFIFDICERNANIFTLRCGVGNAVSFLQTYRCGKVV